MIGRPIATLIPAERQGELRDQIAKCGFGGRNHQPRDGPHPQGRPGDRRFRDDFAHQGCLGQHRRRLRDRHGYRREEARRTGPGETTRALRTLSQANEALVRATSPEGLFEEMCRVIVEVGGYRMAWIGLADPGPGKIVRPVAHAGKEAGYLRQREMYLG